MKTKILLFALALLANSCTKEVAQSKQGPPNTHACGTNGVLLDKSGLGTCKWVIQIDNTVKKLEVINLDSFNVTKANNQKVSFSCDSSVNYSSACMMGKIVRLTCIQDR